MVTLVVVMMIMVCFSFVLKQTFHGVKEILTVSLLLTFFLGLSWPIAIEQSKTQIAAWIADQSLMLDMAVLLSIDVALTLMFCIYDVDSRTSEHIGRKKLITYIVLKFFPGLLIIPVLFSCLVTVIFMLPGVSFQIVAWTLAGLVLVAIPAMTYGLLWLLPERSIRQEMLFIVEIALGLMGIVGTVNGSTTETATSNINVESLMLVIALVGIGMAAGCAIYHKKTKRFNLK